MKYDYVIVGAGLFGATFCRLMTESGKRCLVIEQRNHVGGNTYCKDVEGITVHWYGPHIFHTDSKELYDFISDLVPVHTFINQPLAKYKNELYNLPFNMNTFRQLWGVRTARQAHLKIKSQCHMLTDTPITVEEKALSTVGRDIYDKLIKGYTQKQWGKPCSELGASILSRIPLRFTYDNSYYNDRYQFIPDCGYNPLIAKLLEGATVLTNVSYRQIKDTWRQFGNRMLYTGRLDAMFDYIFGVMEYRSLRFYHKWLLQDDYQSNAVVNYTSEDVPFTRIVEHKYFEPNNVNYHTVITREFPNGLAGKSDDGAYYPINSFENETKRTEYLGLLHHYPDIIIGGRLADYRYYDMDDTMIKAFELGQQELNR